jgi:Ion transport protein
LFEAGSIALIALNSIFLALEDPTKSTQAAYLDASESIFLYIYTFEMVFKMLGLGIILNRGSYLRNPWNVLDFVIVVSGYIPLIFTSGGGINLSGLRSLRVLRPLKTVTAIKKLRALILTIFNAIPYLLEIMVVLFFVFMIFAIAALQLFTGLLQNSCTDLPSGKPYLDTVNGGGPFLCTSDSCPSGVGIMNSASTNYTKLVCSKNNLNPEYGMIHFDNIFNSFLMIYVVTTLEGWSSIMKYVMESMNFILCLFFIVVVFICAFFLINLTLAVITIKFNESQENAKNEEILRLKHSRKY